MADALSIGLSGLMAQEQRLSATASNIANAGTEGAPPAPQTPVSTVYKPLQVSFSSQDQGGVTASVTPAASGVDLNQEIVNLIETKLAFKADISAIKTADQMMGDLLDIVT